MVNTTNKKYHLVRIKTIKELREEYPHASSYIEPVDEVYQMFEKYGGGLLYVWLDESSLDEKCFSTVVLNDKELDLDYDDRFFYKIELKFKNIIELNDSLFEL